MTVRKVVWAGLVALVVAGSGPAARAAQPRVPAALPGGLQGVWYEGTSCTDVASYVFRGDGWEVAVREKADRKTIVARAFPITLLETRPDGTVVVSGYWRDPASGKFVPAKLGIRPMKTGLALSYLAPPAAKGTPGREEVRCDSPKINGEPRALYGDYLVGLTGTLQSAAKIEAGCRQDSGKCAAAVFAVLDSERDGKVSIAEVVRFFRRASKLLLLIGKVAPGTEMSRTEFTPEQVWGAELEAAVAGPLLAHFAMANIDYNGDGFIELGELSAFFKEVGIPGTGKQVGNFIASLENTAGQAANSFGALQQLLGGFGGK